MKLIPAFSLACLCLLAGLGAAPRSSPAIAPPQPDGARGRDRNSDPAGELKALYEAHRWFALRDVVANIDAPVFYRGAVACVFNDLAGCETTLRPIIDSAPGSPDALEANGLLTYAYQRAGRYREALAQVHAMLRAAPEARGVENARAMFAGWSRSGNQSVTTRGAASLTYRMKDGNLFIPVSVNGRTGSYILDTGAAFSTVSESEARRVGMTVEDVGAQGKDSTGRSLGMKLAVADRLTAGGIELRHVAFLVLRDDQQPLVNLPAGERGVVGLPAILAFGTLRWTADGRLDIGFPAGPRATASANLCFEGGAAVTDGRVGDSRVTLTVDTGAGKSDLSPLFAKDFAALVNQAGIRESRRVTGVGHSVELDAVSLPEVTLRIGGFDTRLRPAHVVLEDIGEPWSHGRVGLDVLRQAQTVTFDFAAMQLTLR